LRRGYAAGVASHETRRFEVPLALPLASIVIPGIVVVVIVVLLILWIL
jgi:hypothetical protein